jgi:TetR/AcrR family transcriptional regulator, tetracycline repressor protein
MTPTRQPKRSRVESDNGLVRTPARARSGHARKLYNHVRSKEELITLVADAVCGELTKIPRNTHWRVQLETIAVRFRRVLLSHRDGARVLAATAPISPNRLQIVERVLNTLIRAGFSPVGATDAAWVHNSYVVGFVLDETLELPSGAVSAKRSQGEQRRWLRSLSRQQYPTLIFLANELVDVKPERRFQFGLNALLDGFELRLNAKRG